MNKNYQLTPAGIDSFSEDLFNYILAQKLSEQVAIKTRLTAETVLLNWMEKLTATEGFEVSVTKFLGRMHIIFRAAGERLDDSMEAGPGGDGFYKAMMVNLETVYAQSYTDGCNVFDIKLPRPQLGSVGKVLLAIVGALLIGQLMLFLLPQESLTIINEKLLAPAFNCVMKALGATATFMIFTSVVVSVSCMHDISTLKTLGRALFLQHYKCLCLFAGLATLGCIAFFDVLRIDGSIDAGLFLEIYGVILDIVPGDFLTPFVKGNTLQIVFMAFVSGVVILILDSEVRELREAAIKLNRFFQFILVSICELMPGIIFLSFLQLVITNSILLAADAWKLILAEALMSGVIVLIYFWQVSRGTEESFWQVAKDFLPLSVLALTTSSTIACLKPSEELMLNKYRVPKSLADFGLPLGLILSKPGFAVHFIILVYGFSEMCGQEVNLGQTITLLLTAPIFALALPPVPGGMIAFLNVLFNQYGIPAEMLCIAIATNFIFDMLETCSHAVGNAAQNIVLDRKLKKQR